MRRRTVARISGMTLALAPCLACDTGPRVTDHGVTIHVPQACAFDESRAQGTFFASGDFSLESRRDNALFLRELGGATLTVPDGSRAFTANVVQDAAHWLGVAPVRPAVDIDVLLWPENVACKLTGSIEMRTGLSASSIGEGRALVVGGEPAPGAAVPRSYLIDLTTGRPLALPVGLRARRRSATVTGFPGGAVVAGGDDPDTGVLRSDAEMFVEAEGDFVANAIALSEPRTEHGAVLMATGEVLVVGGRGPTGLLRSLEAIDPRSGRSRTAGLVTLTVPRTKPTVLRLASGELLVAGGFDALGTPVATLEWLAPDAASTTKRARDLIASARRDFIALDSGGALAVVVPDVPNASFPSVWRITRDGALEPAVPVPGLTAARLVPGPSGAPYLFTGSEWRRFFPWLGRFVRVEGGPAAGPPDDAALVSESGLGVWVTSDGAVTGLRFGVVHSSYNIAPADFTRDPGTFAPDRLVGEAVRQEIGVGLRLAVDATAFLSDLRFADVDVDFDTAEGAPAAVVFREESGRETVAGGAGCPLPLGSSFHVERRARELRVAITGGASSTCNALLSEGARTAVGLRGRGAGSVVLRFGTTRR